MNPKRIVSIASVAWLLLPFGSSAGRAATARERPSANVEADMWAYERTRINEQGAYPVPEFLRAKTARPSPGSPHIPGQRSATGVAYPRARQALIERGFIPVRIGARPDTTWACHGGWRLCRSFPEVVDCSGSGMQYCAYLYRRFGTGQYWLISTAGDYDDPTGFQSLRCCGYRLATNDDLDGLTVVRPGGDASNFSLAARP